MFRLHYFETQNHPQLGSLGMDFAKEGQNKSELPFSSIIIGMNGTGKSFILKTIADLFYEVDQLIKTSKRARIPYYFHLRYSIDQETYDLISSRLIKEEHKNISRPNIVGVFALVNRPIDRPIFAEGFSLGPLEEYEIDLSRIKLPRKVIVSTSQLNDRFTFPKKNIESIYRYSGVKRTAQMISTKSFENNIASSLFRSVKDNNFQSGLKKVLVDYLGFEQHLKVIYQTKKHKTFFTRELDYQGVAEFFKKWIDGRKSVPWSKSKFEHLLYEDKDRLERIIDFLRKISVNNKIIKHKTNSSARFLVVDFFDDEIDSSEFEMIDELLALDLITLNSIEIKKNRQEIKLKEISAGENQILMSLLGIYSRIQLNSLILLDEPEISLHPNWQMKYIHLLKEMFSDYHSCHFLIASHSHFLVSDLKPESSSVSALRYYSDGEGGSKVLVESLVNTDTYGWSAEEVLYKVFEVVTTRNYFVATEINEVLEEFSKIDRDQSKIREKVNLLRRLNVSLSSEDPLKMVVEKILNQISVSE